MPTESEQPTVQERQDAKGQVRSLLPLPTFVPRRYKHRNVSSWSGHLAFASDLIVAIRPQLIVELGTHWGEAYFTFCQTVQENGLSSLCYAVDHWLGDEHAGHYGEEVFEDVRKCNERYYHQFSYLLRASFDEALPQFADNSIDLLHVDGLHTYEAAKHDFYSWLAKVKPGGIVMLHDICPKHEGFGVWRLWEEIKEKFPSTFEFHHGWGLGVVRKPGDGIESVLTDYLFASSPSVSEEIRRRYVIYSSYLENLLGHSPEPLAEQAPDPSPSQEVRVQVFPFGDSGYCEETSLLRKTKAAAWGTLVFELTEGTGRGPLRIDPAHAPGFVELGDITIHSLSSDVLLWRATASTDAHGLLAAGTAELSCLGSVPLLLSLGPDPQLLLQSTENLPGPLKVTISLRVSVTTGYVAEVIRGFMRLRSIEADAQTSPNELVYDQLVNERDRAMADNKSAHDRLAAIEGTLRQEQAIRNAMEQSLSWKLTGPLRKLMFALRSGSRQP